MIRPLVVLKFGGSVLRDGADLAGAVHEVYRHLRRGARVLAVVSAFGDTTDRLTREAERVGDPRSAHGLAALLATGEATAAALLVLALERAGIPARALEPHRVGLVAEGDALDAVPVRIDVDAIERAFEHAPALVLPGFVGRTAEGELALLGRGGSDLTALFVAERLGAQVCRLLKDVEGLYDRDPSAPGPAPRRFVSLHWDEALALGGGILQEKAVRFARRHELSFEVGGLGGAATTRVGEEPSIRLAARAIEPDHGDSDSPDGERPLRVALLGLGTVGSGVYRELAARPDLFEVTGVLVRDMDRSREPAGVAPLLCTGFDAVLAGGPEREVPDVVVELLGGVQPATAWIGASLAAGCDVVTANKAALAEGGEELSERARAAGRRLLFSASVCGALPALEHARRLAPRGVEALEGVLNGTTNFVLDRLAEGQSLERAVHLAQEAGYAEADPSLDLDGTDAAHKLVLLARAAFGPGAELQWTERRGIADLDPARVVAARQAGRTYRLVASCHRAGDALRARVAPRALPASDPLTRARDEDNALRFVLVGGQEVWLAGKGAGRWPTTESVLADLFELARARGRRSSRSGVAV